jgi:hypothetical protein
MPYTLVEIYTDVSEEPAVYILRVELFHPKYEDMLAGMHQTTRRHIPGHSNLHRHTVRTSMLRDEHLCAAVLGAHTYKSLRVLYKNRFELFPCVENVYSPHAPYVRYSLYAQLRETPYFLV